jgi:hypothetical protein
VVSAIAAFQLYAPNYARKIAPAIQVAHILCGINFETATVPCGATAQPVSGAGSTLGAESRDVLWRKPWKRRAVFAHYRHRRGTRGAQSWWTKQGQTGHWNLTILGPESKQGTLEKRRFTRVAESVGESGEALVAVAGIRKRFEILDAGMPRPATLLRVTVPVTEQHQSSEKRLTNCESESFTESLSAPAPFGCKPLAKLMWHSNC